MYLINEVVSKNACIFVFVQDNNDEIIILISDMSLKYFKEKFITLIQISNKINESEVQYS